MRTLLLVVLVACSSKTTPMPSKVPSQSACTVDADCAIAQVAPDPATPCCDVTTTAAPMTVAFLTYMADWRKKNCQPKPACPPLGLPGHPMKCAFEAKCVANKCSNAC